MIRELTNAIGTAVLAELAATTVIFGLFLVAVFA